ncbi:amino acid adenylation domain-containing protein [Pedobacter sp. WC2423]|uniref:non-ribosomal peptide synthetase/type I polyketide synthase n=1 Tax=Pedobacter sp. WC2423 TaxID=3234142 RepID=UPI003466B89F
MKKKLEKSNVQDIFELNKIQQSILFQYLKEENGNIYNVQLSLKINGQLDIGKFGKAISIVQSENEALRSVFSWAGLSKPIQIILKQFPIAVGFYDISGGNDQYIANFLRDFLTKDQHEHFDLTELPFRINLIQTSSDTYMLMITHHHILYDGWSTGILLKELFFCYNKLIDGIKPLELNKVSYKEVSHALKEKGNRDEDLNYWKDYLDGYEVKTFFRKENAGTIINKGIVKRSFHLPIQPIEDFAVKHKITKASIMYAVFGLLFEKYTNSEDFVFATSVSGRDSGVKGHGEIIGNFINTIPVRFTSAGHSSFLDIIRHVHEGLIELNQHAEVPYTKIKQLAGYDPAIDLFDVLVVIENYPLETNVLNSHSSYNMQMNSIFENTGIPLVVTVFFNENLEIEFSIAEEIYDSIDFKLFETHFLYIIDQILDHYMDDPQSLYIVGAAEEEELLYHFNDTAVDYPKDATIISRFEAQVQKTPDHTALISDEEGKYLSYLDLELLSNQVGNYLRDIGKIVKGDLVGILLEREVYLVAGIFGVLKSGAAYIPIDPGYPASRIASIIADSGLKVLITRGKYLQGTVSATVIDLDDCEAQINLASSQSLSKTGLSGIDLAYIIYTSGSTGKPKGVMIAHHSVVNRLEWMQKEYPISGKDVLLQKTPVVFDVSVWELFWWSFNGATLCLLKPGGEKVPSEIVRTIEARHITVMHFVPSMLSAFLPVLEDDFDLKKLKSLRFVFSSGEALKGGQVFQFGQKLNKYCESRLINLYGPTEATVDVSYYECSFEQEQLNVPIGKPIDNTQLYVLDKHRRLVPKGVSGELYIGGVGLSVGYLDNEELTKLKFVDNPYKSGDIIYATGDIARWLPDGNIEYLGRIDDQVKIRGFRIEPGEIESHLQKIPGIIEAVVVVKDNKAGKYLIAYYVTDQLFEDGIIRNQLAGILPPHMIPSYFIPLKNIPVNANGKLDRKALPEPSFKKKILVSAGLNEVEKKISEIWTETLGHEVPDTNQNFFDVGGDSLKLITISGRLSKIFNKTVQITDLFGYPTIALQAQFLTPDELPESVIVNTNKENNTVSGDIAIIGMSGRFPGASNLEEFWHNLVIGKESIERKAIDNPQTDVVYAKGMLEDYDLFDAGFFDYLPSEALSMDPQMRVFHECTWEALEDAGYNPYLFEGAIGLYAGATPNPNYNIAVPERDAHNWINKWEEFTYADKDFLCSRVSYRLNLKGPSINVSTACSTSLVAIDLACSELLANKCDMAIAGGVSVTLHDNEGYVYRKGMILSPDGACRAFDKEAAGTVGGNGAGLVVLKRLEHALRDGDHIHAVIKGSATNNDGNQKVGFAAPSVEGQAKVIRDAIKKANIHADTISYIEAHGTGTVLGDPIEIAGLTKAFNTGVKNSCAIGSVKTNIGHLDVAAGVAGLIKTVLCLKNRQLVPSLNFTEPNVNIDFKNSPFYVNEELQYWKGSDHPRRAGISSFGIGGTNAHIIIEEAPLSPVFTDNKSTYIIPLSAKSKKALQRYKDKLINFLHLNQDVRLADIAFTLQHGRAHFPYREHMVCSDREELIRSLGKVVSKEESLLKSGRPAVVYLFSGQGTQYVNMFADLYLKESFFKEIVDTCFIKVNEKTGKDLKTIIFPSSPDAASNLLDQTSYTQPALFILEYALAKLLMNWGINPQMMIGHSIGEYVAACLSGIFTLDDALTVVMKRGELMQKTAHGLMLSILISEQELSLFLNDEVKLSLAAVNSSESCVVSGDEESILSFKEMIELKGYKSKVIRTSHAFHSHLMDEILPEFRSIFDTITFGNLSIPFISNLTGEEASDLTVGSAEYWVKHLRHEVKFDKGIQHELAKGNAIFIEVGPGSTLTAFVQSNKAKTAQHHVVSLVRNINVKEDDFWFLLNGIGKAWSYGLSLEWDDIQKEVTGRKISMPAYSFDKIKYPVLRVQKELYEKTTIERSLDVNSWFYRGFWKNTISAPDLPAVSQGSVFLIFADKNGLANALIQKFNQQATGYITVNLAEAYKELSPRYYEVNPTLAGDFDLLFENLKKHEVVIEAIIYSWTLEEPVMNQIDLPSFNPHFFHLMNMVKSAVDKNSGRKLHFSLLTADMQNVYGNENGDIGAGAIIPWFKVAAQEFAQVSASYIDVELAQISTTRFIDMLCTEIKQKNKGKVVAFRNNIRWEHDVEQLRDIAGTGSKLKNKGVYLITGGLGKLGFELAKYLLTKYEAKVALIGRTDLSSVIDNKEFYTAEDPILQKKQRLEELSSLSGEIVYFNCDITSKNQLENALSVIQNDLGPINGVIHAAGIIDGASVDLISKLNKEHYELQFSSKVLGFHRLYEALSDAKLDFLLLTSSISTLIGGIKFAAYAPANMLMNGYLNHLQSRKKMLNWTAVNFDGIAFQDIGSDGMQINELHQVLEHLVSLSYLPEVTVSMGDLNARMEQWVYKNVEKQTDNELIQKAGVDFQPGDILSTLNKIWNSFFGKEDILPDADFFELGGDSLKALKLTDHIRKELGFELSITDFFENPTIEELSKIIAEGLNVAGHKNKIDLTGLRHILESGAKTGYELSSVQKRLYFLQEFDKYSITYNMPLILRLSGSLDKIRLAEAFNGLLQRHEILRTYFETSDGIPVQKILDSVLLEIVHLDADAETLMSTLNSFIRPFELSEAPLIRVGLVMLEAEEHVLIADIHHIISDGISRNILIKDFMALYTAEKLSPLTLQYKDYAVWQQSEQQQEQIQLHKDFWLKEYENEVLTLVLPSDFPRPLDKQYAGAELVWELGLAESLVLRKLADREGVTMFMLMFAAFSVLLSKLGNQQDVVIGVPVSGRDHAELEDILGMFVNTIPVRISAEGNLSFHGFLDQVKQKTLSCFEHQSYPYGEMIEELHIKRDTSRNPLFDVMFSYQNYEETVLSIPGLDIGRIELGEVMSKFDLTLEVTEGATGLKLRFEYASSLFKAATIARFASYFNKTLTEVLEEVKRPLSEIEIISDQESNLLLNVFNHTGGDYPEEKTLVDLFEEQVAHHPERIAIAMGDESLTYKELNEKSNQLARFFLSKGVRNENVIALIMDRSISMFVSILAVWKAGAAYLPIDPQYPEERIAYIIKDSQSVFTVIDTSSYVHSNSNFISLSDNSWSSEKKENLKRSFSSSDLAYMIYTSGSTGNPKGVMIAHRNVINFIYGINKEIVFKDDGRMLCLTTISFDIFVLEAILPLLNGLRIVLAGTTEQKDTTALINMIITRKVDYIQITPSHLKALIRTDHQLNVFSGIKILMVGGEAFPDELLKELKQNYAGQIYNLYGPTETTVWSAIQDLTILNKVNIGKPILNTGIYILDSNHKLCPVGVPGELCIGGAGLARGYWNNEELTREKFIVSPFTPDKLIYKTGDLGRWSDQGYLEILGRIDNQVKIRGFRIELGEIERNLLNYPGVKESLVTVREKNGDKFLIAYYVGDQILNDSDLKRFLLQYLPEYMVPVNYARIDSIPLTPNGKINRKALPDIELGTRNLYIPAANETEEKLIEIWSGLLDIPMDKISTDKSFFELGGHSLNASLLVSKIRKYFDVELPLKDLFHKHQITAISEYIITVKQMNSGIEDTSEIILL